MLRQELLPSPHIPTLANERHSQIGVRVAVGAAHDLGAAAGAARQVAGAEGRRRGGVHLAAPRLRANPVPTQARAQGLWALGEKQPFHTQLALKESKSRIQARNHESLAQLCQGHKLCW